MRLMIGTKFEEPPFRDNSNRGLRYDLRAGLSSRDHFYSGGRYRNLETRNQRAGYC